MKQLTISPSNRQYYSEDFIKGFECGTQRQLEADKADRPQGKWISNHDGYWICSECGLRVLIYAKGNYCPNCGAQMKGAGDDKQADIQD